MQRINGYYFYILGTRIRALRTIQADDLFDTDKATATHTAMVLCKGAEEAITSLLESELITIRTAKGPAIRLREVLAKFRSAHRHDKGSGTVSDQEARAISSAATDFETVLNAELAGAPLYVVSQKAAFDTESLIYSGQKGFPKDLATKAPESIADLQQATRCIVFELFTAAGFHLHRANESVLHRYWDAVSNGAERPKSQNMGDYLNIMQNKGYGDARTRSALKDLKDLHRNPLIHPDNSINDADEAIALMNGVHNAMTQMLKEMPVVATEKKKDEWDDEIPF